MRFLNRLVRLADDVTGSASTRMAINHLLKPYGTVTELRINRLKKSLDATFRLHGETQDIAVHVGAYDFHPGHRQPSTLILRNLSLSREWMNRLALDFIEGIPLTIPPDQAKYLEMVL